MKVLVKMMEEGKRKRKGVEGMKEGRQRGGEGAWERGKKREGNGRIDSCGRGP